MRKILEIIINSQDLTNDEKTAMIEKIISAKKGNAEFINPGFYLRVIENKENNVNEDKIQLWYRNVDPSTGTTDHGNTGYDEQKIFNEMYDSMMKAKSNGTTR